MASTTVALQPQPSCFKRYRFTKSCLGSSLRPWEHLLPHASLFMLSWHIPGNRWPSAALWVAPLVVVSASFAVLRHPSSPVDVQGDVINRSSRLTLAPFESKVRFAAVAGQLVTAKGSSKSCANTCSCPDYNSCTNGVAKSSCCWSSAGQCTNTLTDPMNCGSCGTVSVLATQLSYRSVEPMCAPLARLSLASITPFLSSAA